MYRAAIESILGFQLKGDHLVLEPCIPRGWRDFEINYRRGTTHYHIKVENPLGLCRGVAEVEIDGKPLQTVEIPLVNDGETHRVRIVLGEKPLVPEAQDKNNASGLETTLDETRRS